MPPCPGQRLRDKAADALLATMKKRGIETRLGTKMVRFEADKAVTETGDFPVDAILVMPGLTGLENSGLPLSPGGVIRADAQCRVERSDCLWTVGDIGSFPAPDWMPKQDRDADLQARADAVKIADAVQRKLAEKAVKPELICFVDTLDWGILLFRSPKATIITPSASHCFG